MTATDAELQEHLSACRTCWDALHAYEVEWNIDLRLPSRPTEGDDEPTCPFCGQKGRHVCHN